MTPDEQIDLYRMARAIAWSYRLQDYDRAALLDLQKIVNKSKLDVIKRFSNSLKAYIDGTFTNKIMKDQLNELERLTISIGEQLGTNLAISAGKIGSIALLEWNENLSVGGVAKNVNTVSLSPEQFTAFFKKNPPGGILIPKVMKATMRNSVVDKVQDELLISLREGALVGSSYKKIVDNLEDSFINFNRNQLTTLTRTFFQTANAQAFDAVYQANQDVVEGKIWTNVNDDRVCIFCLPLGENFYKKGQPHPPMIRHPRCRCLFRSKTVSYRSLGIDLDEMEPVVRPVVQRGYERNGKWIVPAVGTGAGGKARKITFYKNGMKEAFPNLPEALQKELIGKRRLELYKAGKIEINDLVDKKTGRLFLLDELE